MSKGSTLTLDTTSSGFMDKAYDAELGKFMTCAKSFVEQNILPTFKDNVTWKVYYIEKSIFGNYSIVFECTNKGATRGMIINISQNTTLVPEADKIILNLDFGVIDLQTLKKKKNWSPIDWGTINTSALRIFESVYVCIFDKDDPNAGYSAVSKDCQPFVTSVSYCVGCTFVEFKDSGAKISGVRSAQDIADWKERVIFILDTE